MQFKNSFALYKFVYMKMEWEKARKFCESYGGDSSLMRPWEIHLDAIIDVFKNYACKWLEKLIRNNYDDGFGSGGVGVDGVGAGVDGVDGVGVDGVGVV